MANESGLKGLTVGFFGGGLMAEAIIRGILAKDVLPSAHISVSEPAEARRKELSSLGLYTTADPSQMLSRSQVVFIAVKPDIVPIIMRDIAQHEKNEEGRARQLYISICAGVTLKTLLDGDENRRVTRVMPNQPCVVGEAASAFALSPACKSRDRDLIKTLMGACGLVVEVPEKSLDAVTGVSGSGPAFVFMMIEAMADGAVKNGLPRQIAKQLAAQTVLGTAKMVLEHSDVHPAELRNRVESPGGTTVAGSYTLEKAGFRGGIIDAISAAVHRANELGKE